MYRSISFNTAFFNDTTYCILYVVAHIELYGMSSYSIFSIDTMLPKRSALIHSWFSLIQTL